MIKQFIRSWREQSTIHPSEDSHDHPFKGVDVSHETVEVRPFNNQLVIYEVSQQTSKKIYDHGVDCGYHEFGTLWWFNPKCPEAYQYLVLDDLYEPSYFEVGIGHPNYLATLEIYDYMQNTYSALFGRSFESILELGSGGGEMTRHFYENELNVMVVEGTQGGVEKLKSIGIPNTSILHCDLKFLNPLERTFDVVMCTEVAEHIEPWFASKIVENCTRHSDVVWFSAANGSAPPHFHHMNEAPIEAWDNIFAQFDFRYHLPLSGLHGRADRVYLNHRSVQLLSPNNLD